MDADVILDPSLDSAVTPAQGSDIEFGTHTASVRYDGDKGNGGQQTWREVKLAHGNAVISNVLVSQGYSMGTDVSALVKTVTFNGKCFKFDVAPADGDKGDKGDKGDQGSTGATGSHGATGATGANGAAGSNGVNGSRGVDGVNGAKGKDGATMVIHQSLVGPKLIGNTIRTLHVPARKGMKLVSVSAKMRRSYRQPCHGGRP